MIVHGITLTGLLTILFKVTLLIYLQVSGLYRSIIPESQAYILIFLSVLNVKFS